MRTAERLVELLLGQPSVLEAVAQAFVFAPGSDTPEHRILHTDKEMYALRSLASQGTNALIYHPKGQKFELSASDKKAFNNFINRTLPNEQIWAAIHRTEQEEIQAGEQASIMKGMAFRHATKHRTQISPEEERAYRSQIYGMGSGAPPRLGGRLRPLPRGAWGAEVVQVNPDGPLAQARIRPRDVIVRIGGSQIQGDPEKLRGIIQSLVPRTPYELVVKRRGQYFRARVVPQRA